MAYNLIYERWIPVRRAGGRRQEWIAPWQITEPEDDLPVALDAVRPDFNGALIQFLIGLVQTTFAPKNDAEWRQYLKHPPSGETLKKAFLEYEDCFNLDGDGPRFMQERPIEGSEDMGIGLLLLDSPPPETVSDGKDHFVKRVDNMVLCERCTAAALLNLQLQSPKGGRGYFVSIRGGGPLTTLVLGDSAWRTVWLNTLTEQSLTGLNGDHGKIDMEDRFPWMTAVPRTERRTVVTPMDANPHQMFWGMPRRIHLIDASADASSCSLCREESVRVYRQYQRKSEGLQYRGWIHSLSPFFQDKKTDAYRSQQLRADGSAYKNWIGWVVSDPENKQFRAPAVEEMVTRRTAPPVCHPVLTDSPRIWAFGYRTDSAKVLSWQEGHFPLCMIGGDRQPLLEEATLRSVNLADQTVRRLRAAIRAAWFSDGATVRGDLIFLDERFWKVTEPAFHELLRQVRDALTQGNELDQVLLRWLRTVREAALEIFDDAAQTARMGETTYPHRVARARANLARSLGPNSRSLRGILGLAGPAEHEEDAHGG
jgi:CRISPR system Cascade subunit CasA